jgi:two-component sensor histidine kinase
MSDSNSVQTIEKLLRQQAALAAFGSYAFRETDLLKILTEAARVCAVSLGVPFSKVCRYRPAEDDLLIEAGWGWHRGVVGRVVSQANETSPQGRAYVTGEPVIIQNLNEANNLSLPSFYPEHGIISTIDVVIPAIEGVAYGVLEIDSPTQHQYDGHDITFLTGFANVLAEAVGTARRVEAIQALLATQTLLAEELQHRVRNNLQMISSMLSSYARTTDEGPARQGVNLIMRRVTTLAQVYDSLLGIGLSETIDLADYLRSLCVTLPRVLQSEGKLPVEIICHADMVMLGIDQVTSLGMVISELLTNSYGHAFLDRKGTIEITLVRTGSTHAMLTIKDNGIGFAAKADSTRHGVGLIKRLMERAQGTVDFQTGAGGTLWTLIFTAPLPRGTTNLAA